MQIVADRFEKIILLKHCIVWVGNRVTPMHELMELNEDDPAKKKSHVTWLRTVAHQNETKFTITEPQTS